MANPAIHLIVDKGPKQGETLVRNPGTLIRIGRVVKGNTFAIKDPAISQKHLTIEFISEISKWTVRDLDTSNGTFVNDAKIPSLTPFPLSNGDIVKIGETTSISVKIDGDGEVDGGLKRGRRRGLRSRAESLDSVAEEGNREEMKGDLEVRVEEPKNFGRGRTRRANSSRVSKKDENLDAVVEDSVELRPRRAGARIRAASARISKNEETTESNGVADPARNLKETEVLDSVAEDSIDAPKNVARGRARKAPARTRAASAQSSKDEDPTESNGDADPVRILKETEVLDSVVEDSIEVPKNVGRGRPRKAPARTRASSSKLLKDDEASEKGKSNIESKASEDSKGVEREEEEEEEEEGKRVGEELEVDLEKMTLGEWFDSMEKYLPKAINEVAEQMIASLREKAQRFDEYVANISIAS